MTVDQAVRKVLRDPKHSKKAKMARGEALTQRPASAVGGGLPLQVAINGRGRWCVRRAGASRASRLYGSRKEAIEAGKARAAKEGVTLYIHARDGRVSRRIIAEGARRYAKALKRLAAK